MAFGIQSEQITALLDRFAKLPRPFRMAAVPLVAVLILGGYAGLFYGPAARERDAAEKQERDLERKVSEVRSVVSNLAAFETEIGDMEKRLKQALRQLPDSKELPGLLTDVSSLGKDAGLEFKAFRPKEEIARDFYAEVPIDIEFSGNFHDIARFFDRVSKLPRIVNVSQLSMEIADQKADSTLLKVKGQATTFRFLERDNAPAPADPKKAAAVGTAAHGGQS